MADQQFLASDTPLQFDTPADTTPQQDQIAQQTPTRSQPEAMPIVEQQPKTETQSNKEQPPFVKDMLAKASEGQKQAQHASQSGDVQAAVTIEEEILQTFADLDTSTPPTPEQSAQEQVPHHELIAEGEVTLGETPVQTSTSPPQQPPKTPNAPTASLISDVQVATTVSPTLQEEPDGKLTMQELHELKRLREQEAQPSLPIDEASMRLAQELFRALIARIDQEDVTTLDSETAMYREIEKDALALLSTRLAEGRWDDQQDMDSVAMRLGIYATVGMLRNLKTRAQSEPIEQKLQQVLDYLLAEYDRI